ncbi:MAG: hypothetical protein IJS14_09940 [Lentisphaeria bacterium]|nr:hypothetical protein [Lentisphaeria bacterium]
MGKLYRIFTWLILAAAILLVMPVFLFVIGVLRPGPVLTWAVLLVIYGLLIYSGRNTVLRDAPVEPQRHSRVQSLLVWLAVIILITTLMNCLFRIWPVYWFGVNLFYPAAGLLLPVGLFCAFYRPFLRYKSGMRFGVLGLLASTVLFLGVNTAAPFNYAFTGESLPVGYPMPVRMQECFFPEGARDFQITGGSFFIGYHAEWTCTVSEKDFERFRQARGYRFVLNRTDVNEDRNMGPWNYDDSRWPRPYYFHNDRHANGGGLTLRYSMPERKLYGSCSSH